MTGEPDAVKAARPVREGIERKGLTTTPRSQSTLRLAYCPSKIHLSLNTLNSQHYPLLI